MPNDPGQPIDTGTGGFPADDGKLHTIEVVPSPDTSIPSTPTENWSPGQIAVDKTQKDLSNSNKATLGSYLSKVTLGQVGAATKPNAYPVAHKSNTTPVTSVSLEKDGYTVGLKTDYGTGPDTQPHYADISLNQYSNTRNVDKLKLDRTGPIAIDQVDGHRLLPEAVDLNIDFSSDGTLTKRPLKKGGAVGR